MTRERPHSIPYHVCERGPIRHRAYVLCCSKKNPVLPWRPPNSEGHIPSALQPPTLCLWAPVPGMELISFGPLPVNILLFEALPSPSAWGHVGSPGLALLDSGGLLEGQKGQPGPGSRAQKAWRICSRTVDSPPPHGKAIPRHDASKSSVSLRDFVENPVPQTSTHNPPFF